MGNRWEDWQYTLLDQIFEDKSLSLPVISERIGKSEYCVMAVARRRGLSRKGYTDWTMKEREYLKANYSSASWPELLAGLPNHTRDAISHYANKMGLQREQKRRPGDKPTYRSKNGMPWDAEDDKFLRRNYATLDWPRLCRHLCREQMEIFFRAQTLGLSRKPKSYTAKAGMERLWEQFMKTA